MMNISIYAQPRKLFLIDDESAFIDVNGQIVISASDPQLVNAVKRISQGSEHFRQSYQQRPGIRFDDFSEGRAVIGWALCPMCRNSFWVNGIIDETGSLVIPPMTSFTVTVISMKGLQNILTAAGASSILRAGL